MCQFINFSHSLTHSLTHSHTHTLTHSLIHSFTHSFIHSFIHSFTHSLTHSLTHPLTLIHSLTHSHTHSLTHPFTHSHTHSFTHSLTHSHKSHYIHSPSTSDVFIKTYIFANKECVHSKVMPPLTCNVFVNAQGMCSLTRDVFTHQWFGWPLDKADNLDSCLIFIHLIWKTRQLRLVVPLGNAIMGLQKPLTTD